MAESKIKGRDYILQADLDNDATFKPVACLTSNSLQQSLDSIDANSKCGPETIVGDTFEASFQFEGFAIDETGTPAKDSYKQLHDAFAAKTTFAMRMQRADAAVGSVRFSADVFITELNVTSDDNDMVKFSGTATIKNPPATATVIA